MENTKRVKKLPLSKECYIYFDVCVVLKTELKKHMTFTFKMYHVFINENSNVSHWFENSNVKVVISQKLKNILPVKYLDEVIFMSQSIFKFLFKDCNL